MKTWLLFLLAMGFSVLSAQVQYPPNIFPDTLFAPFLYGVASGDPTPDGVILWTRVDPALGASVVVDWEISEDPAFGQVLDSGTLTTDGSRDHTVHVDVSGLSPDTYYYYRFQAPGGNMSPVGRTHSAPSGPTANVRFAVTSCSSIYSGYFNAYRGIGERNDIDAVIHLGDYVYDFVDPDERVRVPVPDPVDPSNLEEWRDLHAYYLLDPDLRLARQNHPWIVIWDNHDIDSDSFPQFLEAVQAFREYIPLRLPDSSDATRIYRSFAFGDLVDVQALDYEQYYHLDSFGTEQSALGNGQRAWLLDGLDNSAARWKVVANQKMFGQFSLQGFPSQIPFGDGPVADSSAWDGHNLERSTILNHLDQNNINNVVLLSGDIHMSFVNDLPVDLGNYDDATGTGSYAVEFIPTSITRGNFDEQGISGFLANLALGAIQLANPHQVYGEVESHGYGILDLRPDVTTAEFFYHDILQAGAPGNFAGGYEVRDGDNHWQRSATAAPTVQESSVDRPAAALPHRNGLMAFPNPAQDALELALVSEWGSDVVVTLWNVNGQYVGEWYRGRVAAQERKVVSVDVAGVPAGTYLIRAEWDDQASGLRIVIQD